MTNFAENNDYSLKSKIKGYIEKDCNAQEMELFDSLLEHYNTGETIEQNFRHFMELLVVPAFCGKSEVGLSVRSSLYKKLDNYVGMFEDNAPVKRGDAFYELDNGDGIEVSDLNGSYLGTIINIDDSFDLIKLGADPIKEEWEDGYGHHVSSEKWMFRFVPETKEELKVLCDDLTVNLGDIDTSRITDMSELFWHSERTDFSGIETWDVSNVENMSSMFADSQFNGDISKWNVSNVVGMNALFSNSPFNSDISDWDVSNVAEMSGMFANSKFNQDLSDWDVSNVKDMSDMFDGSDFNGDISLWDVSNVKDMNNIFTDCPIISDKVPKKFRELVEQEQKHEVKKIRSR